MQEEIKSFGFTAVSLAGSPTPACENICLATRPTPNAHQTRLIALTSFSTAYTPPMAAAADGNGYGSQ